MPAALGAKCAKPRYARGKSFLLLFFKKEELSLIVFPA
jgi:hypothetical protein